MNDKSICKDIIDELDFEPSIDASHIAVSVAEGIVSLSGHVPTYPQRLAAEGAVWRVKGVRGLAQELEVRLPSTLHSSDDEIVKRALNVLAWNVFIPEGAVHVTANHGWVTLSGDLKWNFQRRAAESEVRKLMGVTAVSNHITLKPDIRYNDLKLGISEALKRHAEVEADRITISVAGDKVTLSGQVDDWSERHAVEQAAWSTHGVRYVEDNLRIV